MWYVTQTWFKVDKLQTLSICLISMGKHAFALLSVVDKSGKLLAGPLPTAEQNISEFLRYFVKIF